MCYDILGAIYTIPDINPNQSTEHIIKLTQNLNKHITDSEFWKKKDEDAETCVAIIFEALRIMSILFWPIIPKYTNDLHELFCLDPSQRILKNCKLNIQEGKEIKFNPQARKKAFIERAKNS